MNSQSAWRGPSFGAAALVLVSLAIMHGQTDSINVVKVPLGAIAAQMTGRLVGSGGIDGEYELIGYLTFLEGMGSALFAGEVSESNARFTLRSDRFRFQALKNGSLIHFFRLAVPVNQPAFIRLYYMESPDRDFSRPYTFADGDSVGVLRTRGVQGSLTPALNFRAQGTITVDSATDFTLADRTLNLKAIGESFVIEMSGVPPSLAEFTEGGPISVPFSAALRVADRFTDQIVITPGPGTIGPPK